MIRRIHPINGIVDHFGFLKGKPAAPENPVNVLPICASGESVKGRGKRLAENASEIRPFGVWCGMLSGEHLVAGAGRRGIEITHDQGGQVRWQAGKAFHDENSTVRLNLCIKIKMGVDADHPGAIPLKHANSALPRPLAFGKTARYRGRGTQKQMLIVNTFPFFFVENNVVLPKARRRRSFPNHAVFSENILQKICLEIIGFLKAHEVCHVFLQEGGKYFLPMDPVVGAIISQSEAEVEAQNGKHVISPFQKDGGILPDQARPL